MFKNFTAFTAAMLRHFSLLPNVNQIGFMPEKKEQVDWVFDSCNFSFILQGQGEYLCRGRRYAVNAPCMLIQWPDEPMSYGPDTFWSEMYFIYPGDTLAIWMEAGLLDLDHPVRKMHNAERVLEQSMELYDLLQQSS